MNQKITNLKSLTSNTVNGADLFPIVDVSENTSPTGETKNISVSQISKYITGQVSESLSLTISNVNQSKAALVHSHSIDDVVNLRTILNTTVTQSMVGVSVASLIGGLVPRSQLPLDETGSFVYTGDIGLGNGNKTASNGDILTNTVTLDSKGRYYYVTGSGWFPSGSADAKYYNVGDLIFSDGKIGREWLKIKTKYYDTEKNLIGTPEQYGALGDGVTDDFIAIKHALVSHSVVQFADKTYAVRGFIGVPSNRTLIGMGKDITTIKLMDNSPYGYLNFTTIFQSAMSKDSVIWKDGSNGTLNGSGSIDWNNAFDTLAVDQAVDSPYYQSSPSNDWAGIGYDGASTLNGLRRNVTIRDLTIDCNFNNQAKHSSYNYQGNTTSASYGYIPELNWKVRTTTHAIHLYGENNKIENVKVINYGHGVAFARDGTTGLRYTNPNSLPFYVEGFTILLEGGSGSLVIGNKQNNTPSTYGNGESTFKGNYVINCEILQPGNPDLMNNWSNTSAIVCTNAGQDAVSKDSNFPTDGQILNCRVDPGTDILDTTEASVWTNMLLDSTISSSLSQSYANFFDVLTSSIGQQTGSNNNIAFVSEGNSAITRGGYYYTTMKKISGSWYPYGAVSFGPLRTNIQAYGGYKVHNSIAKNCSFGFYMDTWANSGFCENNQFVDVFNGFRFIIPSTDTYDTRYNEAVVRNNYFKLLEVPRKYFSYGQGFYWEDARNNSASISHIQDLTIENNTFELPVSSSVNLYKNTTYAIPQIPYYQYENYNGLEFRQATYVSGSSELSAHRNVRIKNNNFVNFNVNPYASTGNWYCNPAILFFYTTASNAYDMLDNVNGPYQYSYERFKNQILPNYTIEGNTYSSQFYPSTASVVPIQFTMINPVGTYYNYLVNQQTQVSDVRATGVVLAQNTTKAWAIWDNNLGNSNSYGSGATISTGSSGVWTCSINAGLFNSNKYGCVANIYDTGSIRMIQIYETGSKSSTKYYFDTYALAIGGTTYVRLPSNTTLPPQQIQLTFFGQ